MKNNTDVNREINKTSISRRDFLSGISKAGIAIPFVPASALLNRKTNAKEKTVKSEVILTRRENATSGYTTINQRVVQEMFDESLKALTGKQSTSEAWESILPNINPSKETISLKLNCASRFVPTHAAVTFAITNSLVKFGIPENNIILWDLTDDNVRRAGYKINDGKTGIRCFGNDHPGIGYDEKIIKTPSGIETKISRILTNHTDYLINVPVLKNHIRSGVTLCLKNHFGSIINPKDFHQNISHTIPQLNLIPEIKNKTILNVADALYCVARRGPSGPPTFIYNGLMMGFDPVALDYQAKVILENNKCPNIKLSQFLPLASDTYNLGNSDPEKIQLIEI